MSQQIIKYFLNETQNGTTNDQIFYQMLHKITQKTIQFS